MKNKISVIVPVYKVEDYLHRCIDSIINQTHKNLEIILVNDGSPDNSGSICDEYALLDKRINVIHKINEGSSCARNAGLDIAVGDYISFIDSDDYIENRMFEVLLNYLKEHELEIVESIPNNKKNLNINNNNFRIEDKITTFKRVIQETGFAVWRRLYKRTLVEDLRFIPKIIHQDVFYTIDVLNRVNKIGICNTKFYNYNMDNESIIRSKYSLNKIKIGIMATEYIRNNTPKIKQVQEVVNNYVNHYYTDHYFLLSRNKDLDERNLYRKKLRKSVRKTLNKENCNLRSLLVAYMSPKVVTLISLFYKKFISTR